MAPKIKLICRANVVMESAFFIGLHTVNSNARFSCPPAYVRLYHVLHTCNYKHYFDERYIYPIKSDVIKAR